MASGVLPKHTAWACDKVAAELAVLTPEEDEAVLREAGFSDVRTFYGNCFLKVGCNSILNGDVFENY